MPVAKSPRSRGRPWRANAAAGWVLRPLAGGRPRLCDAFHATDRLRIPGSLSPAPHLIEALDRFRNPCPAELFDAGDEPVGRQRAFPDIFFDGEHRDFRGNQSSEVLVKLRWMRDPLVAEREPRRILALHRIVDRV